MRGKHAQRARGVLGPLASDFLLAIRGTQQHKNLPEFYSYTPTPSGSSDPDGSANGNRKVNTELRRSAEFSRFPDFVPRSVFNFGPKAAYFPPHMSKGLVELQKRLRSVECVVEVRDARAPLTSSGCLRALKVASSMHRLVVLNKCDLVPTDAVKEAKALIVAAGLECVTTSATDLTGVQHITSWLLRLPEPKYKSVGRWMLLAGLPNTGKSSLLNALKRLAFSAGFHGHQWNQLVSGVKKTLARTGKEAGVTKIVQAFQLTNKPRVYCLDSPGILVPNQIDAENSTRLAALGIIPSQAVSEEFAADYVLFELNRRQLFGYVDVLDLPYPTNDVNEVAHRISETLSRASNRFKPIPPDLRRGFHHFLALFRAGYFGKVCLDSIPSPDMLQIRKDVLDSLREPPDPWTKRAPEDVIMGLT